MADVKGLKELYAVLEVAMRKKLFNWGKWFTSGDGNEQRYHLGEVTAEEILATAFAKEEPKCGMTACAGMWAVFQNPEKLYWNDTFREIGLVSEKVEGLDLDECTWGSSAIAAAYGIEQREAHWLCHGSFTAKEMGLPYQDIEWSECKTDEEVQERENTIVLSRLGQIIERYDPEMPS